MTDFITVDMGDGTTVAFEAPEQPDETGGGLTKTGRHGGSKGVAGPTTEASVAKLTSISASLAKVASALRSDLAPDELSLDVNIGLEAEVGWFFARSKGTGSIAVHVSWKPNGGR